MLYQMNIGSSYSKLHLSSSNNHQEIQGWSHLTSLLFILFILAFWKALLLSICSKNSSPGVFALFKQTACARSPSTMISVTLKLGIVLAEAFLQQLRFFSLETFDGYLLHF